MIRRLSHHDQVVDLLLWYDASLQKFAGSLKRQITSGFGFGSNVSRNDTGLGSDAWHIPIWVQARKIVVSHDLVG